MSIWAPVVAALGASALTGAFGFGAIWWQQRHAEGAAALATTGSAYRELIAQSLSFTIRARTLRNAMQMRSGLTEGVDVAMRLRRPVDPFALHDWLAHDFVPMNQAWSTIQTTGSAEAVEIAASLMDACADLLGIATELGEARGKIASAFKGLAWTTEQQDALQNATARVVTEREAFIRVARHELGAASSLSRLS